VSTVALPRWLVGLLVAVSAVSLVAVAFLLGRVTTLAPTRAEAARLSTAAAPPDARRAQPAEAANSPGASDSPLDAAPARSQPPAGGSPEAAAVAAYFRQMDAIAAEAKSSQDPQTLARSVLDQTLSGNMGAIDGLIAGQRKLETRLAQIVPPPACREHHQRSLRLFGRAVALLERTRGAVANPGGSDLDGVAAEGREIEEEARALDALANDIRRAAGLAPTP